MEFLNSLKKRSKHYSSPFSHWDLNEPLTEGAIKEICKTEITDLTKMDINYDGTRAVDGGEGKFRAGISDGGKAIKFRCFVSKDNSKDFPNLNSLIEELRSKDTYGYISELIKKDLSNSYVRVEVICDRQGFLLKPHFDIKEKLISGLFFVNPFNESENLGTDFYDEKLNKVKTVPYKNNYGYFLRVDQIHGMVWKKKKLKKKEDACKLITLHFRQIGK